MSAVQNIKTTKPRSIWTCSGTHWAYWSAGWTTLLAAIVLLPVAAYDATQQRALDEAAEQRLIAKLDAARSTSAGAMKIHLTPFNFMAQHADAYGDLD